MKLLKLVSVDQVQAGDTLILGASRYVVTSIDDEAHGREFRLKDFEGYPKCKFIGEDERIAIEL